MKSMKGDFIMKKWFKPTKLDWMFWGTLMISGISVVAANLMGYYEGRVEAFEEVYAISEDQLGKPES
jgi:hypothetical protein